jgi:hypothetical protein
MLETLLLALKQKKSFDEYLNLIQYRNTSSQVEGKRIIVLVKGAECDL